MKESKPDIYKKEFKVAVRHLRVLSEFCNNYKR